jgi:RNA polymerase sigma-70 factor (ECF subfamily)
MPLRRTGGSIPYRDTIRGIRDADFERLYEEHAQSLFRFLSYRTGDPTLSEDLLADTFEKVLRTRARARPGPVRSAEKPWLYAIALNCLRDGARRRQVEQRALERVAAEPGAWAGAADHEVEAVDRRDEVQHALAGLGEDEREALALRFGADLTVPEIARVLRVPLSTAEGRVYRGLRKLREILG